MEFEILTRALERLIIVSCVPILLFIGYRLFVMGATGAIQLSANGKTWRGKLTNLSPSTFCFLLSVALGVYALQARIVTKDGPREVGMSTGVDKQGQILTSFRIRALYGDAYLCFGSNTEREAKEKCEKKTVYEHFHEMNAQILKEIQELEERIGKGDKGATSELQRLILDKRRKPL